MPIPQNVLNLAWHQGGCVTRSQLSESGLTRRQIDRLVASGELTRSIGMTYRLFPARSWHDDLRAGLAAIPGSVVSHQSAANIHEFPRIRNPAAVITAHTRTTHDLAGVKVIRSHDLAPEHIEAIGDIRVTTVPRTVFDLCAVLHHKHSEAIVMDLVLEKRLVFDELHRVLESCARRGKPGVRALRDILDKMGPGFHPMTELERRGFTVVERAGVTSPVAEYGIPWDPTRRFDLAWPRARVAIEWDSRRWHGALEQMTFDRRRDRAAVHNGWVILRFTWDDVTVRPDEIGRELRSILRQRVSTG